MILANNKKLLISQQIRQYGWDNKRNTNITGINSRLDEIQNRKFIYKIKKYLYSNKKRNYIANQYFEKIKTKITLPSVRKTLFMHFIYLQF